MTTIDYNIALDPAGGFVTTTTGWKGKKASTAVTFEDMSQYRGAYFPKDYFMNPAPRFTETEAPGRLETAVLARELKERLDRTQREMEELLRRRRTQPFDVTRPYNTDPYPFFRPPFRPWWEEDKFEFRDPGISRQIQRNIEAVKRNKEKKKVFEQQNREKEIVWFDGDDVRVTLEAISHDQYTLTLQFEGCETDGKGFAFYKGTKKMIKIFLKNLKVKPYNDRAQQALDALFGSKILAPSEAD